MALQKAILSIPMSLGIDSENAPALVDNNRFTALSNVVFNKDNKGQLHKRPGHTQLGTAIQGGGVLPAAQLLAMFNDELNAIADDSLYSYSNTNSNWQFRGAPPMVQAQETNISAGAFSVANPDACYIAGLAFYVYELNGSTWVKVVDDGNKSIRANVKLTSASGALYTPKILANGSSALVIATDNTGVLWFVTVDAVTLTPVYHSTTEPIDFVSNETSFDATINGGAIYIAAVQNSKVVGISYSATGPSYTYIAGPVVIANSVVAPAPVSIAPVGSNVYVTTQYAQNSATLPGWVEFFEYSSSTWTFSSSGAVSPSSIAACPRITSGSVISGGVPVYVAFYETAPAGGNILASITYVIGGTRVLWSTGCSIAGQPFSVGTSIYLPAIYASTVQQTLFLTYQTISGTPDNVLAHVAGRYYSANDAGAPSSNFRIAAPFNVTSTTASFPAMVQPQGISASTVAASLAEVSLTFAADAQFSQLGGNLHLACGSQLMDYDGTNLVEHNFHVFPETPTISYLTSQLTVITDSYDPTDSGSGPQGSFRIAIPDNAADPGGPVGQLITPGEYITLMAISSPTGTTPSLVWFSVDGSGSAPAGTGVAAFECVLSSDMTATQIATKLYELLVVLGSGNYAVTYTPTTQTNTATPQFIFMSNTMAAGHGLAPPVLDRVSTAAQVYIGSGVGAKEIISISVPPAMLISSGQYGAFSVLNNIASGFVQTYFWFDSSANSTTGNQDNAVVDPQPFGKLANSATVGGFPVTYSFYSGGGVQYVGVKITLAAADEAAAVALKIANALNALGGASFLPYVAGFGASQVAGVVAIQSSMTAGIPIVPASHYPTTNIGQGYVGAVIDNSTQPYAAIEYSDVYEWIDSQNQLQQSAPSVPAIAYIPTYTTVGGVPVPVSAVVQVSTRPISLTLKTSAIVGTDLDIAIYRTISGATVGNQVFYRITPTTSLLFNQPSSLTAITYADFSSDGEALAASSPGSAATGVQANQLLYTTGGVQPNAAPPACSYVINHQNRLWLTGLENPSELWYSEIFDQTAGQAVNFTQAQYQLVNPTVGQTSGGPIVALASMDSNLIIFQENQIWYIQGNGPDPTGGNGFFTNPQIVASSSQIGCRDVNSVVLMPNGVMFKSTQGFWLLGRDLQLRYVGAAVKAYNSDVVTSAVAITSNSQINFLSNAGTTLMYDWYYDSWSTFTTNGMDSVIDGSGLFNMVTSFGAIWVQAPGQYIDGDGSSIIMSIQTAWLKPSNVQGFQRVWKAFLEGQFFGTQPYQVQIGYNYSSTVTDTFTLNVGAGGSISTWGASATWGANVWGEDGSTTTTYVDQIQLRVFPSNQLCESIQFTITDLPPVPLDQTWSLNALDLEIGIRYGGMKQIGNPQSLG